MNVSASKNTYSVPPVERALKLMRYIGDGNHARNLSIVSRDLGINRTTLIRLIHTLLEHRMIEEIGEGGGYRLGAGLVSLGAQAIQGRDIVQVCHPVLRTLCQQTGMSAHLGVLDGRDIIYLSREAPNSPLVSNVRAGSRLLAHASSIGRAILAEMTEDSVRQLFSGEPLKTTTEKTPSTVDAIVEQARLDKSAGYAWSEGNFEPGIGSCAAAIFDHTGRPVGGLNVSGPESRFSGGNQSRSDQIRDAVLEAAQRASSELGFVTRSEQVN
ncbi:IclR family transcriptional regulator [Hoeflea prorocentri]|uniref:IclR family transcriptional regulator n=1 Tax=Hoeflea prorocentri TaxID=1922333 RepID=A0A9X3UID6_9HYPH|nr:IclR family transcriptional regulator [Hoeflea prorocentri]MCY6379759.1 IclR family transcriptional regulator [Hoeflea prorocentri]MDA5397559.1 IclR family transcriptional regulator [Hoeflea prorocentri]